MEELYCKGAKVWLPDRLHVWVSGEVCSALSGEQLVVLADEGDEQCSRVIPVKDTSDLPPLRNPKLLVGANDLTTLSYLHEPAVLHNLYVRFQRFHSIYTYCGIVLVAVNPYTSVPIYGKEFASAYSNYHLGELDPHIYAVAEDAYRTMTRLGDNHAIVVSGESGAGKTVSAKYAMRYFATVGGGVASGGVSSVETQVLASNPIMEAIGNAKTIRNDNSSRFGKYLDIVFDAGHGMSGAHMSTYLLERSRCVHHTQGERNYHIFYQICAAAEQGGLDIELGHASQYNYTNQGDSLHIAGVDDFTEYRNTQDAFRMLGFTDTQRKQLVQVLAAILNLGNVQVGVSLCGGEEVGSIPPREQWLMRTAALLGVDHMALQKWLTHKKISTVRETITKPLTHAKCVNARDSLAKHLYAHLFDWVVSQLNHTLSSQLKCHASIGVLDIYGFEVFEENSFEQFCINYANEKLQQQFNLHVFKLEQQEYVKEGIAWSFIDFHDNQPCIDLLEGRLGIGDLIDETCKIPRGDDAMLLRKLCDVHLQASKGHFSKPLTTPSSFTLRHYAGLVTYHCHGFVEKNRDMVMPEHMGMLKTSHLELILELFKSPVTKATTSKQGSTYCSVGSQFRTSLSELMKTLNSTTPHYIRCIKPNDQKLPFKYDMRRVVEQLRACGVLETVRISAAGYPSRWTYHDFQQRYHPLLPRGYCRKEERVAIATAILRNSIKCENLYRMGRSKVFFRAGQVAYLEKLCHSRLHACGLLLQTNLRAWLARTRYLRLRGTVLGLQRLARGYLARRLVDRMKRERAAVQVQKCVRGYLQRVKYLHLRLAVIVIQTQVRGRAARQEYRGLLHASKAVCIQRHVRGWLVRRDYRHSLRNVLTVQSCARRWLAKRELKRLKVEARSVKNLRQLNKGMENKIIELQQKLTHQLGCVQTLQIRCRELEQSKGQGHTSLVQCQQVVSMLEESLAKEKGRGSTLEEELNAALAEKVKLTQHISELESNQEDLELKLAELNLKLNAVATEDKETILKSPCLTPAKNYWKTPVKAAAQTTPLSGRGPMIPHPRSPIAIEKSVHISQPNLEDEGSSPILRNPEPAAAQDKEISSILLELESYQLSTPNDIELDSLNHNKMPTSTWRSSASHDPNHSPLLNQSLSGLRHAYNLINTLAAMNVTLQDKVTVLSQDLAEIQQQLQSRSALARIPPGGVALSPPRGVAGDIALTPLSPPGKHDTWLTSDPTHQATPQIAPQIQHLGMLSWQPVDQARLLKQLIVDLKPEALSGEIPCLPAHLIFMCLRYADYSRNKGQALGLMQGVVLALQGVQQGAKGNIDTLVFWLANTNRLKHHLHQYSAQQDHSGSLMNFDLSEYEHMLHQQATSFYHNVIEMIHKQLKPLIVAGLVEYEAIPGMSSSRPCGQGHTHQSEVTVDSVLQQLSNLAECLARNFLEPLLTQQIFRQVFYIVNAYMLNSVLLRRELCHWSKGVQIRYNASQLEDWCRLQGVAAEGVAGQLTPIIQASKLLQMKKSTIADVNAICDLCTQLNALQVQKLLTMYNPSDQYEDRVPESVVRLVAERGGASGVDPSLIMIDVTRCYPIQFHFMMSDISFSSLTVTKKLHLPFLNKI